MDQGAATVLFTCLGYASETAKAGRVGHVSAEEWRSVAELARLHSTSATFSSRLKPPGIALPGELAEELKQKYWRDTLKNIRLYQELRKLFRLLYKKEIAMIALSFSYPADEVKLSAASKKGGRLALDEIVHWDKW